NDQHANWTQRLPPHRAILRDQRQASNGPSDPTSPPPRPTAFSGKRLVIHTRGYRPVMAAADPSAYEDPPPPDLRLISRELATLRMQLVERGISGPADASEIKQLGAEIERLAADLRRMHVPPA